MMRNLTDPLLRILVRGLILAAVALPLAYVIVSVLPSCKGAHSPPIRIGSVLLAGCPV